MGGNVGFYDPDEDEDPSTHGTAVFQQFDAFGVNMTKPVFSTRSFAWRGQEGSVTDREAGLVHMQARHYDPSTRLFLSKDPSRNDGEQSAYQYCLGNPVKNIDPTGYTVLDAAIAKLKSMLFGEKWRQERRRQGDGRWGDSGSWRLGGSETWRLGDTGIGGLGDRENGGWGNGGRGSRDGD